MAKKKEEIKRAHDSFMIDVYEAPVHVGICDNIDELERWYTELTGEDEDEDDDLFPVLGLSFYDDEGDHWILFTKDKYSLNTCAHECFHLTHHVMDDINHKFKLKEHEPHAWLHGFLVEKVHTIALKLKEEL